MNCGCENRRLAGELDRQRRLAKGWARMEGTLTALYRNEDGTFGFMPTEDATDKDIVKYLTPY